MSDGIKDLATQTTLVASIEDGDALLTQRGEEIVRVPVPVLQALFGAIASAPRGILLNNLENGPNPDGTFSIQEKLTVGTELFELRAIDFDVADTHTFTLISSTPPGLVEIDGDSLKVANTIDAAVVSSIVLSLQVTDQAGLSLLAPKVVTLRVEETPAAVPVMLTPPILPETAPTVGNEFRATLPTWTADPRTIFDHQWMIDLIIPVSGAMAAGINPDTTHVGRRYRLRTTATAPGRTPVIVFSDESLPVEEGAGALYPGLTAISATHNSVLLRFPAQETSAYRFRWKVGAGSYTSPVAITVADFDVAGTVKEVVVANLTNSATAHAFQHQWQLPDGSWSAYQPNDDSVSITLAAAPPAVNTAPTLTANPTLAISTLGAPQPGTVISVSSGAATGHPTAMTTTYRALRNRVAISGATSASYTAAEADIGSRLSYEVRISNGIAPDIVFLTPETDLVVEAPPAPGTGSGTTVIELAPPNLDCPLQVSLGPSTDFIRTIPNSAGGNIYQDAIISAPNPTAGRRGRDYVRGYANKWVLPTNFEAAMFRPINGRGETYMFGPEWDGRFAPEVDPTWVDTQVPEEGLPHRITRVGGWILTAPGTWYSHNSIFVNSAQCTAAGVWSLSGSAHRALASAKIPEVGEVIEIVGGRNVAARRRWIRIDTLSSTGGGDRDFAFTITGTDVTEGLPTSQLAISTTHARTAYAVREFRCASGVLTLRFVSLRTVSTDRGVILNQVYRASVVKFYEACDVYHISAWNAATQTATLEMRTPRAAVTGINFTIPGSQLLCSYYDSRHRKPFDVTNHADAIQVLDHSLPVEIRDIKMRVRWTYQYLRHNGRCKFLRLSEVDSGRLDQFEFPEVFPVMNNSQGLDLQSYGATLGMIRQFNDVRWEPDPWRDLVASQPAEPAMQWVDVTETAVRFAPGSSAAVGTTGVITKWNGVGERVSKGQSYTRNYTFDMPQADAPPSGVNLRIMTGTTDVRSVAANTPLLERFIQGPRRGIIYDVSMPNTAGGRLQLHTANGGKTRCVARGTAAMTAGTYTFSLRITSNPIAGRTVGHDVTFECTMTVNSSGVITSAGLVGGGASPPPPPPGPPPPPPPPGGYHVDADALMTRMNNVGAALTTPEEERINALITALVTAGVWADLDVFYMLRAPSQAEALLDWKPGARNLTKEGNVSFSTSLGAKSDGAVGSYLVASGYNPNTAGGQFTKDSASIIFVMTEQPGVTGPVIGGGTFWVNAKDGSSRTGFRANDGTTNNSGTNTNTDALGMYVAQREGATTKRLYRNGSTSPLIDVATASTALMNSAFFVLTNAGATPPASGAMGFAAAGKHLTTAKQTALKNALDTYFAAL